MTKERCPANRFVHRLAVLPSVIVIRWTPAWNCGILQDNVGSITGERLWTAAEYPRLLLEA